jgi:hypothetical protein
MRIRPIPVALATLLATSGILPSQGSPIVDEGSFTISIGGRPAGRENFRISTLTRGTEVDYQARADVAYGDRKITPTLRTDSRGTALEYDVTRASDAPESWRGVIVRGRLSATLSTPRGPAAREFIVPTGALIMDDDLFHQLYFVALRTKSGRVPVIVPHRNDQFQVTVSTVGTETVQVGTRDLDATHLQVNQPSGAVTDVWVDSAGRLLRVAVPARRLVAVRDDPPRG